MYYIQNILLNTYIILSKYEYINTFDKCIFIKLLSYLYGRFGHQKFANSFSSSGSSDRTAFQSVSGYSSKFDVSPSYDTEGTIGGWKENININKV